MSQLCFGLVEKQKARLLQDRWQKSRFLNSHRLYTGTCGGVWVTDGEIRTMRTTFSSGSPYEPTIGFCRALRINDQILVSGTAPISETGEIACPGDPSGQTRRCIDIAKTAIEALGGSIDDVVRTRIYLKRAQDWEAVGSIHGEYFSGIRPTSTMLQVAELLNPDWLVEIEFDAVVTG